MELANTCMRTYHVLKRATEVRDADSLSGPSETKIDDFERCAHSATLSLPTMTNDIRIVHHIETAIRECANDAHGQRGDRPRPAKECLVSWQVAILEIVRFFEVGRLQLTATAVSELPQEDLGRGGALEAGEIYQHPECLLFPERERNRQPNKSSLPPPATNSSHDVNFALVEDDAPPVSVGSDGIDAGLIGGSGFSLPLPPRDTNNPSDPPLVSESCRRALQRLVNRAVPQDELPSVIETIVSSVKAANVVECLEGGDAQSFIDAISEARHHIVPSPRNCFTDSVSIISLPSIRH